MTTTRFRSDLPVTYIFGLRIQLDDNEPEVLVEIDDPDAFAERFGLPATVERARIVLADIDCGRFGAPTSAAMHGAWNDAVIKFARDVREDVDYVLGRL